MKFGSRLMIAAMAWLMPVAAMAQALYAPVPDEQGPGMGMQRRGGPGAGHRMGPGYDGQRGRMGMRRGHGMRGEFQGMQQSMMLHRLLQDPAVRERLNITPEQMSKLQAQEGAMAKAGIRNRAELQIKRIELGELMRAENPDRAAIDKKLREMQDATFAAEKARIDGQLYLRDLFTPEQRKEMEKMRGEFRGRMMQRGPGGPGGPGGRMGPGGNGPRGPRPTAPPKPPPAENDR